MAAAKLETSSPSGSIKSRAARLKDVPLFGDLSARSLERVAKLVFEFEADKGAVLINRGTAGAGLFVIDEGTVEVMLPKRKLELGPGEFVGELALLDPRAVRTARVRATAPVRGWCITRDAFTKLIESEAKIAAAMLRVLARRLADSNPF